MKKVLFALFLMSALATAAQDKINPVVKKGSKFIYTLYTGGNTIPFTAVVDSLGTEYVKIAWNIEGIGTGGWVMKKKSLETATHGYWSQPTAGTDEDLGDETTVLLLSKAQWNGLQQDKKFVYNDQTFTVKQGEQTGLKVGSKTLDAIQVEGPGGTTRLWILNNAGFPALLKVEGNSHGVDLELTNIE
ncbi:hypothetical protein D3H65_22965 [Paraflavitalea soli]|uniref:DUF3108 domain-containing protein n=1 Tax=Paraflavitalea soli TaxID=2315862 RepID=A0A3B7MTU6_9BACT|nr:hypothetical protein [Paraflavitalea soli]AXY76679.1 hypothetical protein D3H65_22965 [Paraflavitalea soli]